MQCSSSSHYRGRVGIITPMRTWATYCRNAVRFSIGIARLSTRSAPNHSASAVERFMIIISAGIISAKRWLTFSDVAVRSWAAIARTASRTLRVSNRRSICRRETCFLRHLVRLRSAAITRWPAPSGAGQRAFLADDLFIEAIAPGGDDRVQKGRVGDV